MGMNVSGVFAANGMREHGWCFWHLQVLQASVVNTSTIALDASVNEPVQAYVVTVFQRDRVAETLYRFVHPVPVAEQGVLQCALSVPSVLQGDIVVNVSSIDIAGNVDTSPSSIAIVSISTSPDATVTVAPPALTNESSVSFVVTSGNELEGLLAGFHAVLTLRNSSSSVTSAAFFNATLVVAEGGGGSSGGSGGVAVALQQTVSFADLGTGVYDVSVWAVDVLGNSGPVVSVHFEVSVAYWTLRIVRPVVRYGVMVINM